MPEFEPEKILQVLARHDVGFVLIGGLAASAHGSPHLTRDVDITPDAKAENLARLSLALKDLGARVRVEGVDGGLGFDHDAESLAADGVWNLTTIHGDLDISFKPSGTEGFSDLSRAAITVEAFGANIRIASLEDIVRSKQAADRPKDQLTLHTLREILANRDLDTK